MDSKDTLPRIKTVPDNLSETLPSENIANHIGNISTLDNTMETKEQKLAHTLKHLHAKFPVLTGATIVPESTLLDTSKGAPTSYTNVPRTPVYTQRASETIISVVEKQMTPPSQQAGKTILYKDQTLLPWNNHSNTTTCSSENSDHAEQGQKPTNLSTCNTRRKSFMRRRHNRKHNKCTHNRIVDNLSRNGQTSIHKKKHLPSHIKTTHGKVANFKHAPRGRGVIHLSIKGWSFPLLFPFRSPTHHSCSYMSQLIHSAARSRLRPISAKLPTPLFPMLHPVSGAESVLSRGRKGGRPSKDKSSKTQKFISAEVTKNNLGTKVEPVEFTGSKPTSVQPRLAAPTHRPQPALQGEITNHRQACDDEAGKKSTRYLDEEEADGSEVYGIPGSLDPHHQEHHTPLPGVEVPRDKQLLARLQTINMFLSNPYTTKETRP